MGSKTHNLSEKNCAWSYLVYVQYDIIHENLFLNPHKHKTTLYVVFLYNV